MTGPGPLPAEEPELEEWTDDQPGQALTRPGTKKLTDTESEPPTFQEQKLAEMQQWVLLGVGVILLVVLGLVLAAVWDHGVTPDFGLEIGRMVLPSLVGSATTIVGALFVVGAVKKKR